MTFDPWWGDLVVADAERERLARQEDKREAEAELADRVHREPTDDEIYNGPGVEGGIAYDTTHDEPGSLGENDWRL